MIVTVSRSGKRLGIVISLSMLWGGCELDERLETSEADQPCAVPSFETTNEDPGGVVVVRGTDAPCAVMFEPVQELTGVPDGTLPRPPVSAAPGGRWLTATYVDGEFAVWSPSGDLERLIGLGSGDGPGEFGRPWDLIVDSIAGTVHVFSMSPRIEVYSLDGTYLEGVRLPSPPRLGARLNDGTIATASTIPMGSPKILLVKQDTVFRTGPAGRMAMPADVRAGAEGVWTAESPWYQFDHHALPGGQVDFTIRRDVSWFPALSEEAGRNAPGPLVMGFTVDPERRLVFARIQRVEDPDAPGGSPGLGVAAEGEAPRPARTREEVEQINTLYFDGVVEVFTVGGDLVASTRFDNEQEMPWPIGGGAPGNLWFRLRGETIQSIEILRPKLVEVSRRR